MNIAGQIATATEVVLFNARFDVALQCFCDGVPAVFRREPRLVRAIGDTGAFATVAVIIARQTEQGITLARVQRIVCGRLASTRRVRAMVDELARTGAVVRIASAIDARQRPFRAGGWLMDALVLWLQSHIAAAYPWIAAIGGSPTAESDTVVRFLAAWVDLMNGNRSCWRTAIPSCSRS